jgi:hypothetical protein
MTLDEEDEDGEAHGREAYHAGLLPTDNTYREWSPQNIAWSRGYEAAKAAGPPVPTAAASNLRQDAVLDRAATALQEVALNYIDALREYHTIDGVHKEDYELYEDMLEFIEDVVGRLDGYARPEEGMGAPDSNPSARPPGKPAVFRPDQARCCGGGGDCIWSGSGTIFDFIDR